MGWQNFPMNNFGVQKPALKKIAETPEIPRIINTNFEINNVVNFYGGRIKNLTSDGEISATGMHDKNGILVMSAPKLGAFKAIKLQRNDVVLKVNGVLVNNVSALRFELNKGEIGSLSVWRNQTQLEIKSPNF